MTRSLTSRLLDNRIVNRLHWILDCYVLKNVPLRASNPYLTHLPILLGLGRILPIRKVLELGSGDHSSLAFLDKNCFPDLEHIDSFENDIEWGTRIGGSVAHDKRFHMNIVTGAIAEAVSGLRIADYDLVFIDDSISGAERSETIKAVATQNLEKSIIAIHDFEYLPYRLAAAAFQNQFRFTAFNPNTGVVWSRAPISRGILKQLNHVLAAADDSLPLNDRNSLVTWLNCNFTPIPQQP